MKNLLFLSLLSLLLTSCITSQPETVEESAETCSIESAQCFEEKNPIVKYSGALKDAMINGDITPKIQLFELKEKENLYALGAVGNLKGEIQIFDSKPVITSIKNKQIMVDETFDSSASLLVYAQVKKWKEIIIPNKIQTREEFEIYLQEEAQKNGLNTEKPFPFLLNGVFAKNDWHVINWDANDTKHSHKKHIESGLHGTMKDVDLDMLGFFSTNHSGIFTHHTTNMHIHFKTKDGTSAGHSDDLVLGENMTLRLPSV